MTESDPRVPRWRLLLVEVSARLLLRHAPAKVRVGIEREELSAAQLLHRRDRRRRIAKERMGASQQHAMHERAPIGREHVGAMLDTS